MAIDLRHPSPVAVPLSTSLMRYMDVGKFFDLLLTGELHLSRLDLLRGLDPREGRLPDIARRDMSDLRRMSLDEIKADGRFRKDQAEILKGSVEFLFEGAENFARTTYVSCWHIGAIESMAMWSVYAGRGAAVALHTTVDRLCTACTGDEIQLLGGGIKYIDPHAVAFEWGNLFNPTFRKHQAFEFEREFRLAWSSIGDRLREGQKFADPIDPREFVRVKVNLRSLVEAITPAPNMPQREQLLVRKIAADFGFGDCLRESSLTFKL